MVGCHNICLHDMPLPVAFNSVDLTKTVIECLPVWFGVTAIYKVVVSWLKIEAELLQWFVIGMLPCISSDLALGNGSSTAISPS